MLSKTDILSMHDQDYMNETQVNYFKNLLNNKKSKTIQTLKELKQEFINKDFLTDINDMGTAQELQQQNLITVNIKNKELQETLYALNLIESDEYGYCQQSGNEIGIKRLLANPTATLTVEAKSRQEFMLRTRGVV